MGEYAVEMDDIKKIAVLGSGAMGIDIALLFALRDVDVSLWHKSDKKIASDRLSTRIEKYVAREIISHSDGQLALNKISPIDEVEDVAEADLVVESVVEDFEVKSELFVRVDKCVSSKCIVASNTSSLRIDSLASSISNPERFAGFHFFKPALKIELVEIVQGKSTSSETIDVLTEICRMLKKKSVLVKDAPGFIVNYLMAGQINQAIRMYEGGLASVEDIDAAVKLGLQHPMGPLELADYIGLDVLLEIFCALQEETNNSLFMIPDALAEKVKIGDLGRKSGRGFYEYNK